LVRRISYFTIFVIAFMGFVSYPAAAQSGRTFYIDYASGSNGNPGTSTGSPWKTHPYMQTSSACTGSGSAPAYSHQAGDRFIFKGGVTWPAACFRMLVPAGGTFGAVDYYGVDQNWFAGASFTRPIFDGQNAVPAGNTMITVRAKYITFDYLELARMKVHAGVGECADANYDLGSSSSGFVTVQHNYIHDWTIDGTGSNAISHGTGSICQNQAGGPINAFYNTITDQNTAFAIPFGACFRNLVDVAYNSCTYVGEGMVGHFGATHDNEFAHSTSNGAMDSYFPGSHLNIIEDSGYGGGDGPIYNNLIHDNQAGITISTCGAANIYNNVMWSNYNNTIYMSTDCGQANVTSTTQTNVYNNTIDCSGGSACFSTPSPAGYTFGVLNLQNNIFITNGSPICVNSLPNCNYYSSLHISNNRTMSTSEAASYGLTSATKYAPTSSIPNVTGTGANLASLCNGNLAQLCSDVKGAPWYGGSYVQRPLAILTSVLSTVSGSTGWDAGAYQSGGQTSSKPTPPAGLTAVVQ
jgi:hypothetical protein